MRGLPIYQVQAESASQLFASFSEQAALAHAMRAKATKSFLEQQSEKSEEVKRQCSDQGR